MISGYQFWKIWHPLHLHFTSSYDIFKYNAKCKNLDESHFEKRKDSGIFKRYGPKFHNTKTAGQFILANFINNNDTWIYSTTFEEANEVYLQWKSFQESATYKFKNEFDKLVAASKAKNAPLTSIFEPTPSGKKPPLLQFLLGGYIHKETILFLDANYGSFIRDWKDIYSNDPLITDILVKLEKYKPFLNKLLQSDKIKEIIEANER